MRSLAIALALLSVSSAVQIRQKESVQLQDRQQDPTAFFEYEPDEYVNNLEDEMVQTRKSDTEQQLEQQVAEDIYMKQLLQVESQEQSVQKMESAIAADLKMKQQLQESSQETGQDMLERDFLEDVVSKDDAQYEQSEKQEVEEEDE